MKGLRSLASGGGSGLVLKDLWVRPFRGAKILGVKSFAVSIEVRRGLGCSFKGPSKTCITAMWA